MLLYLRLILLLWLLGGPFRLASQRSYSMRSVLAEGNWFQVGTTSSGIYRITGSELQQMGFSLPFPSGQLRIFGRATCFLSESPGGSYSDDLAEMAISIQDGGDGQIESGDFALFYSGGPHHWVPDPVKQEFRHKLNLYSDTAFYYITAGGVGKRIENSPVYSGSVQRITSFQYRFWHEKELFNLLSGGQEWYGERFLAESNQPLQLNFTLPSPVAASKARFAALVAARSVGTPVSFDFLNNGTFIGSPAIAPVTSSGFDFFARETSLVAEFDPSESNALTVRFNSSNASAIGWLNRFQVLAECRLEWNGKSFDFRSWKDIAPGRVASYAISGAGSQLHIWKVTDPLEPRRMPSQSDGNQLVFNDQHEYPEEYMVFDPAGQFPSPIRIGSVSSQNLHGAVAPDLLIITAEGMLQPAEKLADWHRTRDGISSLVVPVESVYHEFSAGIRDPTAIRDFVKMFYDRSGGDISKAPRFLLLLGDASFDPKNRVQGSINGIPSFQSHFSLDPLSTYVSDDYFGFLDDGEDINGSLQINQLDIAIGRIPAGSLGEANIYVDKIIAYHQPSTRGSWRNELSFIADDEDGNLHLQDMEQITRQASAINNRFLQQKYYLDAFPQVSDAAGSRYPLVNQAISDQMQKGTLIWNYTGHGGFRRLADEVILDQTIVDGWQQNGRLPLFVTATCDFAPYDNPAIQSLGEYLLFKPAAGAIALMTTTRLVFAYSNRILNANYMESVLQRMPDGRYRTLGEASRDAKNKTFQQSGDIFNNLKFTLLGDPALSLVFPENQVMTTSINDRLVAEGIDTVKALQEISIGGNIVDAAGNLLSDFNGWVYPSVLDQPYEKTTLANDPGSAAARFIVQDRTLYRGQVEVKNGYFQFSFLIPRDIDYKDGNLRIIYYAMDSTRDAQGGFSELVLSGSVAAPEDREGPIIRAYINDSLFRPGDLVGSSSRLILKLTDPSGINVLGRGFGHDISLVIDEKEDQPVLLNNFFQGDTGTYKSGSLEYRLPSLADGWHKLTIKAWDLLNNSSTQELRFRIKSADKLELMDLGVWPNPSRGTVRFVFAHNQNDRPIQAWIELFSFNGQLIKKINGTIIANGNRSYMEWDGRNQQGVPVPKGNYLYRLIVRSANGRVEVKSSQLIRF